MKYQAGISESIIAQCAIAGALHVTDLREYRDADDYNRIIRTCCKLVRSGALKRRRKGTYDMGEQAPWWAKRLREWRPS